MEEFIRRQVEQRQIDEIHEDFRGKLLIDAMRYDSASLGDIRTFSYDGALEGMKSGFLKRPNEILIIIDRVIEEHLNKTSYVTLKVSDRTFNYLNHIYSGEIFRRKIEDGYIIKVSSKRATKIEELCKTTLCHG